MRKLVIITNDLLNRGRSRKGGWTKEQLAILGVEWPPPKGWKEKLLGTLVEQDVANRFVVARKG